MLRAPLLFASLSLLSSTQLLADAPAPLPFATSADEQAERDALNTQVRAAIAKEDFAALTAMESKFCASRTRSPSGTWRLAGYHAALQFYLADGLRRDQGCAYRMSQFVDRWQAATPRSPAPIITDAALILERGWCLRGNGYAAQVPDEVWPEFHAALAEARDRLEANQVMASADPEYYVVKLNIMRSGGADKAMFRSVVEEAAAREPYYHRTYFKAALFYLPEWGGSFAEVDRFARWAATKTRGEEKTGFYARIYWALEECGCDVISKAADWTFLRQAMADTYTRFPVRWNGDHFADTACRSGDVEEGRRYIRATHPQAKNDAALVALFGWCDGRAHPPVIRSSQR